MRLIKWKHINRWFEISANENFKFTLLNEFYRPEKDGSMYLKVLKLRVINAFN